MENLIFRREDYKPNEPVSGSIKEIGLRRRKDMTALVELFTDSEKSKLVRKVFDRSTGQYDDFLKQLETRETWQEAHKLMEDEFYQRKVDLYSKEARILTDKVYQIFFPEDI